MEENKKSEERFCGLTNGLKAFAVLTLIAGFICAFTCKDPSSYFAETNYAIVANYILGGIFGALFIWSLSYIVDACDKYLKS